MIETPVALIVLLAAGTVAAVVLALLFARSRQESHQLRFRAASLQSDYEAGVRDGAGLAARLGAVEAEVAHLAEARVPDAVAAERHPHVPVRGALAPDDVGPELERQLTSVLEQTREAVRRERMRVDFAAQAAMRGATTTIQALLYQLQTLLQRMQEKYDDPLVAEDLLAADFLNEQALRRIQSTAVVCGAWPGLTRNNSHLADVVVGAMSRLNGYERVQVSNRLRDPVGVVARAVEPVAVVLTELIGNALHFSHPELPVSVTLQQGNRGVSVIVDDAGVGMSEEEVARAERLMSGEEPVLVTELGDPPRTGFAAVGRLLRQYGFSARVETSPYGGVRAIVHIPGEPLLTLLDEKEYPQSPMAPLPSVNVPRSAGSSPPHESDESDDADGADGSDDADGANGANGAESEGSSGRSERSDADGTAADSSGGGLPRRRRKRRTPPAAGAPASAALPEDSARRWAAFQHGTESARAAVLADEAPDAEPARTAEPPTVRPGPGVDAEPDTAPYTVPDADTDSDAGTETDTEADSSAGTDDGPAEPSAPEGNPPA